jgi:hypothetical protein
VDFREGQGFDFGRIESESSPFFVSNFRVQIALYIYDVRGLGEAVEILTNAPMEK